MPTRDFYTLAEAARVLEIPQRRLLELLEAGEIEGEQDPHSSRWRIPKRAIHEPLSGGPSPEDLAGEVPERSPEMIQHLGTDSTIDMRNAQEFKPPFDDVFIILMEQAAKDDPEGASEEVISG